MKVTFTNRFVQVFIGVLALCGLSSQSLAAVGDPPVQIYYLPVPEDQAFAAINSIFPGNAACGTNYGAGVLPAAPMQTYTSISVAADDTIIYVDHWEDGFEADLSAPTQTNSEIWGDGDLTNGIAPGVASDLLVAGTTIIVAENAIDPTTLATIDDDFDGGDKFGSTEFISVTRTMWASGSSTLLAGALEMYDVTRWGTQFTVPVGEDLASSSGPLNTPA